MSYHDESYDSEDYTCKHTMSNCDCYEYDEDEVVDTKHCCCCSKSNPIYPYRLPKKHGGWVGYFCSWNCVEKYNERGGGDSASRQHYINKYKLEKEYWKVNNPGY